MKLCDLIKSATIQGDVRISAWSGEHFEEETVIRTFDGVEFVLNSQIPKEWRNAEVLYLFCGGDGFLHIEVEAAK